MDGQPRDPAFSVREPGAHLNRQISVKAISALLLGMSLMIGACGSSGGDRFEDANERCEAAEDGAEAIALRAADLRVTSTRRSALTTIGSVAVANPQPIQHEVADPDRAVCAFVFEGSRPQSDTSLMLVVVDPDDVGGEQNLLGHNVDGASEPDWWTAALGG